MTTSRGAVAAHRFGVVWVDRDALLHFAKLDSGARILADIVVDTAADPRTRPVIAWDRRHFVLLYTAGLEAHRGFVRICG